jgi:hypothetical protein
MSDLYAMRRANGDWFALDHQGRLSMPVFWSVGEASIARLRNSGMECFRPVLLDARAIQDLETDGNDARAWIVKDASLNLKRGLPLEFAQLAILVQGPKRA